MRFPSIRSRGQQASRKLLMALSLLAARQPKAQWRRLLRGLEAVATVVVKINRLAQM